MLNDSEASRKGGRKRLRDDKLENGNLFTPNGRVLNVAGEGIQDLATLLFVISLF